MRAATALLRVSGLLRGHDARGDVVVEREDGDRGLADGEGRSRNDRRQETFEALAGPGQFGRDAWRAGVHLRAYMVRYQTNNALAVRRRQCFAGINQATRQPVNPQPPIGIEHDLDDRVIFQVAGNRRAKRATQHSRTARIRLRLNRNGLPPPPPPNEDV